MEGDALLRGVGATDSPMALEDHWFFAKTSPSMSSAENATKLSISPAKFEEFLTKAIQGSFYKGCSNI